MKKSILLFLALLLLFAGCSGAADSTGGSSAEVSEGLSDAVSGYAVTDLLGRTVTVPSAVERVACIGAGALRLYSYIGDLDRLCGVESCEYGFLISARPYQMVNAEFFAALPAIGTGGPQGAPDAEALLAAAPDVIFSLYTADAAAMDRLREATGIPVVVLSYGKTEAFDEAILRSLTLMGRILGREERAAEVIAYITAIQEDLDARTRGIPDDEKKTVYLGCQSNYGTHGIGSSSANYSLFDAVNAKNILDLHGYRGYQGALDLETIVTLDPQVMLLDAGGLAILRDEYNKNRAVFDSLTAFQTGALYVQMPYNAYYTNLEIAFADAYFIGKTLFPDAFADVEAAEKLDEIATFLLGAACYEEVVGTVGIGYGQLTPAMLSGEEALA